MKGLSLRVDAGAIAFRSRVSDKRALFEQLAATARQVHSLPEAMVLDALSEREQLGSTGFGNGVALPHARIAGLDRNILLFASLDEAIPYDALDDQPIDVVFALLSNAHDGKMHLKHLAEISRYVREPENLQRLRGAENEDALYALLNGGDRLRAA